ncbi:MAG: Tat pathway signal sequence domain protein [Pseudomonadota bacterium]
MIAKSVVACIGLSLLVGSALAQETGAQSTGISVELNKLETEDAACRPHLVLENQTEDDFEKLVLDLVMFDKDAIIARRLAVDIAPLRSGRLAVKVFSIPDLVCEDIGRMLVNGVLDCTASGAARSDCLDLLATRSRAEVDLIN